MHFYEALRVLIATSILFSNAPTNNDKIKVKQIMYKVYRKFWKDNKENGLIQIFSYIWYFSNIY